MVALCPVKSSVHTQHNHLARNVIVSLVCFTICETLQALGLLATVLLRQPEHCEALFGDESLMSEVMDVLLAHRQSPTVMRQACQLIRNLVVRNPELRQPLLRKGLEPLLRSAKSLKDCDDVAAAALRDLGFNDYNA
jgi:armadillo repeat-containing protein 6